MCKVNALTKEPIINKYVYTYLLSLKRPVVVFRDSCARCPMGMRCVRGDRLSPFNTTQISLRFLICPRCWCVFIVLNTIEEKRGTPCWIYVCARLRDGIFRRNTLVGYAYKHPSAENVEAATGYNNHYYISHITTPMSCAGEYKIKATKHGKRKYFRMWNPEHPRNLSNNEREYLSDGTGQSYRDDSVDVNSMDCVDLMKKGPYGAIIL